MFVVLLFSTVMNIACGIVLLQRPSVDTVYAKQTPVVVAPAPAVVAGGESCLASGPKGVHGGNSHAR
jgi:hypothetical protein